MAKQREHPAEEAEAASVAATEENGNSAQVAVPLDMSPAAGVGLDWMGQQTYVEAARAAAETQAMVVVAQRRPRDERVSWERLERSCGHRAMALVAFYDYPRGGKRIIGPTVKLVREALRCWGNAAAGITELRRVDSQPGKPGYSEMLAFAWDMETNYRPTSAFIAPHIRERDDSKGGTVVLDDEAVRDIRETNAGMAGRVVREMAKQILPPWFLGMAEDACRQTLTGPPGKFIENVDNCVAWFAARGVSVDALEEVRGLPRVGWGPPDLVHLAVIRGEIERDERTIADAFPGLRAGRGGAAAHLAKAAETPAAPKDPGPAVPDEKAPGGPAAGPGPDGGPFTPGAAGEAAAEKSAERQAAELELGKALTAAGLGGEDPAELRLAVCAFFARPTARSKIVPVAALRELDDAQLRLVTGRILAAVSKAETAGESVREIMLGHARTAGYGQQEGGSGASA